MDDLSFTPFEQKDEQIFLEWFKDDSVGIKFLESYSKPSDWIHLLDNLNRLLFIVRTKGLPIGFFDFEKNGRVGHFVVYVSKSFRNRGIGREILARAFKLPALHAMDILDVNVEKDNLASIKLLEEAGFKLEESEDEGMLVYKKSKPFALS